MTTQKAKPKHDAPGHPAASRPVALNYATVEEALNRVDANEGPQGIRRSPQHDLTAVDRLRDDACGSAYPANSWARSRGAPGPPSLGSDP